MILLSSIICFQFLSFRRNDLWGFSPESQRQYFSTGASWYLPAAQISEFQRRWKAQHYPQAFTALCGWSPRLLAQTQRVNQSDTNWGPRQVLLQYINETNRFHSESRGAYEKIYFVVNYDRGPLARQCKLFSYFSCALLFHFSKFCIVAWTNTLFTSYLISKTWRIQLK